MKVLTLWMLLACAALIRLTLGQAMAGDEKHAKEFGERLKLIYGPPGPEHKALQPLVGTWNAKIKWWVIPGAPPDESEGVYKRKWILEGRFIEEHFDWKPGEKVIKTMGLTGYDRYQKRYTAFAVDSLSTGMATSHGTYDKATKTFTFAGELPDANSGGKMKTREVIKIVNDDHHILETYCQAQKRPELKTMEIHCTRQTK